MSSNGINHRRVPPYHPSSNELAENMLKTVKQALNKAHKGDVMEAKIAKFLAEILLGRAPKTRLSLVHPCMAQRMSIAAEGRVENQAPQTFEDGQAVYLRDLHPTASDKWDCAQTWATGICSK